MSVHLTKNPILMLLLLAASIAMPSLVQAQAKKENAQRSVELEFEAVEGATSYEIELVSLQNKKVLNFKMKKAIWKAKVKPGLYEMRLRSFDSRGVPGEWSPSEKFAVNVAAPTLLSPRENQKMKTGETTSYNAEFKWTPVPGAQKYKVTVQEKGSLAAPKTYTETTDKPEIKISLPVAKAYDWTVVALMLNETEGDKPEANINFEVLGAPLDTPSIDRPLDKYVQKLTWDIPNEAQTYDYTLQRKDGKTWKSVEKKAGTTATEIVLSNDWVGGDYRLNLRAQAPFREPSKITTLEFPVHNGDRSPAAVETMRLRESLEKPTNWYAMASYLVTNVNYQAVDAEQGKTVSYGAVGGTGRLGLGYFKTDKSQGFVGVLDMSGMNVAGKNVTYSAVEANYVRAYYWNSNQIQVSGGLFYKELPYSRETTPKVYTHDSVAFAGPHIGGTLWHPFSPRYGVQLNARGYMSMFTVDTPNGNDVENSLSMQVGVMGSMRLTPRLMGFAGYAMRDDKIAFKRGAKTTTVQTGSSQEISVKGNYLNLLLEYGF